MPSVMGTNRAKSWVIPAQRTAERPLAMTPGSAACQLCKRPKDPGGRLAVADGFLRRRSVCVRVLRIRSGSSARISARLTPEELAVRLQRGWRRFGPAMFRPECPACRQCQSLRVPVVPFRPSRSQQRAWNANRHDISLAIGRPTASTAHRSLYDKFHRHQSREKGWRSPEADGAEAFLDNPFATEEWRYTSEAA